MPKDNADQLLLQFNQDYEQIRQTFNQLAEQNQLGNQINALLGEMEKNDFDHGYYWRQYLVSGVNILFDDHGILNNTNEYYTNYKKYQENKNIQEQRTRVSNELINTIDLLGEPKSYTQALARQKLLAKINPYFCDPKHAEVFKNLQKAASNHIACFSASAQFEHMHKIEMHHREIFNQQQILFDCLGHTAETIDKQNMQVSDVQELLRQLQCDNKEHVLQIIHALNESGIELSSQLIELLAKHETTQNAMQQLLDYVDRNNHEEIVKTDARDQALKIQGIESACVFLQQLGAVTRSKHLSQIGSIAQASVQIYSASRQLLAMSAPGLMLINPISAIGIAALNVFSLFNKQKDVNSVILKQLHQLNEQVRELHKTVVEQHQHIDKKLSNLLENVIDGFERLQHGFQAPALRQLTSIEKEVQLLSHITQHGFEQVLSQTLQKTLSSLRDVRDGILPVSYLHGNKFERAINYLQTLRDTMERCACDDLFVGGIYSKLLQGGQENQTILKKLLLHVQASGSYYSIIKLLIIFIQEKEPTSAIKTINTRLVFHPEIWSTALESYLWLIHFIDDPNIYDPNNKNLSLFKEQANHLIRFIDFLQKNKDFYTHLLADIKEYTQVSKNTMNEFVKNTSDIHFLDIDNLDNLFSNQTLLADYVKIKEPELPKIHTQNHKSIDSDIKTHFFKPETLLAYLSTKEINIAPPNEFITAAALGLGHFEYQFIQPDSLRERKHHKDQFRINSCAQLGLNILFHLKDSDKTYVLYTPSSSLAFDTKSLSEVYRAIICRGTKKTDWEDPIKQIRLLIHKHIQTKKLDVAQQLFNKLCNTLAYQELIKTKLFLLTYLDLAGFPPSVLEKTTKVLGSSSDLLDILRNYIHGINNDSNHEALDLMQLQTMLPEEDALDHWISMMQTTLESQDPSFYKSQLQQLLNHNLCAISQCEIAILTHPKQVINVENVMSPYLEQTLFPQSQKHSNIIEENLNETKNKSESVSNCTIS